MTYSFKNVSLVISHPLLGQIQIQGEGIGSVTTSMTDDRTQSTISADGVAMKSKIESKRGTYVIEFQQISSFVKWLVNAYNILDNAGTDSWNQISANLTESFDGGIKEICSGGAFQKMGDRKRAQTGDNDTWTIMFDSIIKGAA